MKIPAFRSSLALTFVSLFVLGAGPVQAQPLPRSISDCRAIEGELARYACYESLEDPAAAAAPAGAAPQAPAAAPATPARPVSNLPVVRRPSLNVGDLTGESAAAEPATTAVVREQEEEEKPGLLRRLLPFGGDDDDDQDDEAAAPAAPAVASGAGSEVDSFGRDRGANGARVATNEKSGLQELVDTVASVRTLNQNMIEVTLESGQVWRQMISKRYPLQVGETVIIRPTRWGSAYRLTAERISGFIQVERVD
jgi:hypothetical protein